MQRAEGTHWVALGGARMQLHSPVALLLPQGDVRPQHVLVHLRPPHPVLPCVPAVRRLQQLRRVHPVDNDAAAKVVRRVLPKLLHGWLVSVSGSRSRVCILGPAERLVAGKTSDIGAAHRGLDEKL